MESLSKLIYQVAQNFTLTIGSSLRRQPSRENFSNYFLAPLAPAAAAKTAAQVCAGRKTKRNCYCGRRIALESSAGVIDQRRDGDIGQPDGEPRGRRGSSNCQFEPLEL